MTNNLFDRNDDESGVQIFAALILALVFLILLASSPAVVIAIWKALL